MSREAMEAAMDHSGVNDPFGQNILVSIGRFIAADTKQGWVSDRKAAEVAKCDKGTIGSWRARFIDMGIIDTWTTGAGRGTKRWYRFLFPFDESKHETVISENGKTYGLEPDNKHPDINQRMSGIEELLYGIRDLLSGSDEKTYGINVRNVRPRTVQDHHNTNLEHQEHRERAPAPAPGKPHPNAPWPETDTQKQLATHPATFTWLEAGFEWPGYDNISLIVDKMGADPDLDALVKARQFWSMSSYRPGNYLGILDWYENIRGDPAWEPSRRFSQNGKHPAGKENTPDQGLKEIKPGVY